ncbi:MAG: hypothetical protein CL484_04120 [Acidobacteria bacterium]|nr:hypothetical protein [Acidobacteriota bacterium]
MPHVGRRRLKAPLSASAITQDGERPIPSSVRPWAWRQVPHVRTDRDAGGEEELYRYLKGVAFLMAAFPLPIDDPHP